MAALIIGDDANRMVRKPTFNVIQSPARLLTVRTMRETQFCHFGGRAIIRPLIIHQLFRLVDFVLFALVLSKGLLCESKRDILILHFKVCTFNS